MAYLTEQKVATLSMAAVMAEEFFYHTHKSAFMASTTCDSGIYFRKSSGEKTTASATAGHMPGSPAESQRCFYSHQVGHVIADCMTLKAKGDRPHSDKQHTARVNESVRNQ